MHTYDILHIYIYIYNMYISIYIYICICVYIYIYIYICIYIYIYIYIHAYTCLNAIRFGLWAASCSRCSLVAAPSGPRLGHGHFVATSILLYYTLFYSVLLLLYIYIYIYIFLHVYGFDCILPCLHKGLLMGSISLTVKWHVHTKVFAHSHFKQLLSFQVHF